MLQLDPADLLVALCRALTEAGGTITDHTRVTGIDGTTLRTDAGDLRAGQVVLATASPILDTGRVTMSLSPERSYLGAYEVTGPLPEGMYISAESPTISVRAAAGRLLVGGQGHPTGQETRTQERLAALDAWAEHHFPGARRTHGWSAQDYHPVGGVPVVEKLSDGVVFAGGYSKWGHGGGPGGRAHARQSAGRPRAGDLRRHHAERHRRHHRHDPGEGGGTRRRPPRAGGDRR